MVSEACVNKEDQIDKKHYDPAHKQQRHRRTKVIGMHYLSSDAEMYITHQFTRHAATISAITIPRWIGPTSSS